MTVTNKNQNIPIGNGTSTQATNQHQFNQTRVIPSHNRKYDQNASFVYPQNEADVQVGIIYSNEPAICEHCCNSTDENIINQSRVPKPDLTTERSLFDYV